MNEVDLKQTEKYYALRVRACSGRALEVLLQLHCIFRVFLRGIDFKFYGKHKDPQEEKIRRFDIQLQRTRLVKQLETSIQHSKRSTKPFLVTLIAKWVLI